MNSTYKLQVIRQLGDEQVLIWMCHKYVTKKGSKPIQHKIKSIQGNVIGIPQMALGAWTLGRIQRA
jgi:hypothetical protein